MTRTRIVVADEHALMREALRQLLTTPQWEVVGEASGGSQLIEVVEQTQPQLVITELFLSPVSGLEATRILKKRWPSLLVIALTTRDDEHLFMDMMHAGAKGYLLKNMGRHELYEAIRTVLDGEYYYGSTLSYKLVRMMSRSGFNPYKPKPAPHFTDRELQIIRLICQQLSSREIASRMHMNRRAVESTRERLQEKIRAKNMVGIALYAIKNGIYFIE